MEFRETWSRYRHRRSAPLAVAPLSQEGRSEGLCPACVFELALESPSLLAELEDPDDDGTLVYSREAYSPGQVLGKRYRIRSLLGRGGMGEVWRASDLKLRVDVALKALRRQLLEDTRALETLRQEVRVAREVISPNVCRVFDLVELDGQELVSMEYIDGITLLDILKMRAPLELAEAREIASQFLAGLEAIHEAGLVHRDVKPENLMMTRSGRVVLMDFGIAKGLAEGMTGTVSGTPAYMAPEQARGEALDARADVFSAGVVLAEMIAPAGVKTFEARQQIWQGIHHEPPEIPDSPWAPVLTQAVASAQGAAPRLGGSPGAGARGGHAAGGGSRGRQALPRSGFVHRRGCRVLLRPRARSRGDVEEAPATASAGADRPVGRRQELLPASRSAAGHARPAGGPWSRHREAGR